MPSALSTRRSLLRLSSPKSVHPAQRSDARVAGTLAYIAATGELVTIDFPTGRSTDHGVGADALFRWIDDQSLLARARDAWSVVLRMDVQARRTDRIVTLQPAYDACDAFFSARDVTTLAVSTKTQPSTKVVVASSGTTHDIAGPNMRILAIEPGRDGRVYVVAQRTDRRDDLGVWTLEDGRFVRFVEPSPQGARYLAMRVGRSGTLALSAHFNEPPYTAVQLHTSSGHLSRSLEGWADCAWSSDGSIAMNDRLSGHRCGNVLGVLLAGGREVHSWSGPSGTTICPLGWSGASVVASVWSCEVKARPSVSVDVWAVDVLTSRVDVLATGVHSPLWHASM